MGHSTFPRAKNHCRLMLLSIGQVGIPDQSVPALQFIAIDRSDIFRPGRRLDLDAEFTKSLADARLVERGADIRVEACNNRRRRAGGRKDHKTEINIEALQAKLG